jgi:hypothetical protein
MKKHPKGMSREELLKYHHPDEPVGSCDAALLCSMIYHEDGAFSVYFIGVDGREEGEIKENLEDNEWFKVWAMLANRLAESKTLEQRKKSLCAAAMEDVRFKIFGIARN